MEISIIVETIHDISAIPTAVLSSCLFNVQSSDWTVLSIFTITSKLCLFSNKRFFLFLDLIFTTNFFGIKIILLYLNLVVYQEQFGSPKIELV